MKCLEIRELSSDYIDGSLDEKTSLLVKSHMEECEECAKHIEDINYTVKLCNSLKPLDLPENFSQRLNEKLKLAPPWYLDKKLYASALGLAASIFLIASPLYNMYERNSITHSVVTETNNVAAVPVQTATPQIAATPVTRINEETPISSTLPDRPAENQNVVEKETHQALPQKTALPEKRVYGNHDITPQATPDSLTEPDEKIQSPSVTEDAPMVASKLPETVARSLPKASIYSEDSPPIEEISEQARSGGGGDENAMFSMSNIRLPSILYINTDSDLSEFKAWVAKNIISEKSAENEGFSIIPISLEQFEMATQFLDELNVGYIITDTENADLSAISGELTEENYIIMPN